MSYVDQDILSVTLYLTPVLHTALTYEFMHDLFKWKFIGRHSVLNASNRCFIYYVFKHCDDMKLRENYMPLLRLQELSIQPFLSTSDCLYCNFQLRSFCCRHLTCCACRCLPHNFAMCYCLSVRLSFFFAFFCNCSTFVVNKRTIYVNNVLSYNSEPHRQRKSRIERERGQNPASHQN